MVYVYEDFRELEALNVPPQLLWATIDPEIYNCVSNGTTDIIHYIAHSCTTGDTRRGKGEERGRSTLVQGTLASRAHLSEVRRKPAKTNLETKSLTRISIPERSPIPHGVSEISLDARDRPNTQMSRQVAGHKAANG